MKSPARFFLQLFIIIAITFFSQEVFAGSTPPDPGGSPTGGGPPVGGGAPIGSGTLILIAAALTYALYKVISMWKKREIVLVIIILITGTNLVAQVSINTDGSTADESSILDVKSNSKGFLPPRMTEVERDAISNPTDGLMLFNTTTKSINFYVGGFWYETSDTPDISTVINTTTGKTWMDRNLGASRVALGTSDAMSYGSLYQWGRLNDGHQVRFSGTTTTLSITENPGHNDFILTSSSPDDWITPQNNNLWQGESGTNNPCPKGFRLPTITEWEDEVATWTTQDAVGAYSSVLKLTVGGLRSNSSGSVNSDDIYGFYSCSTTDGTEVRYLFFCCSGSGGTNTASSTKRAKGLSIRCIKD